MLTAAGMMTLAPLAVLTLTGGVLALRAAIAVRHRRVRTADGPAAPLQDVLEFCADRLATTDDAVAARAALDVLFSLGDADPAARQAVVDVVCAYLRRGAEHGRRVHDPRTVAVIRLGRRLGGNAGSDSARWADLHLDLRGASVENLDLRGAVLRSATFADVHFTGTVRFTGARCAGRLDFTAAQLDGPGWFDDVDFNGPVRFTDARFDTAVSFARATFRRRADFAGTWFTDAEFAAAVFLGDAVFSDSAQGPARFTERAGFDWACFTLATFAGVRWPDATSFRNTQFSQPPHVHPGHPHPGSRVAAADPMGGG